jgi:ferrous iron transport protein A
MPNLLPLQLLPSGHRARIDQLLGRPDDVHRLQELGLRVGSRVEMVQTGKPCIVTLDGAKLAFRHDDDCHVLVRTGEVE